MQIRKSLHQFCTEHTALPAKPGVGIRHAPVRENWACFRLVQLPGSHELCFNDPAALADAILRAGRD